MMRDDVQSNDSGVDITCIKEELDKAFEEINNLDIWIIGQYAFKLEVKRILDDVKGKINERL